MHPQGIAPRDSSLWRFAAVARKRNKVTVLLYAAEFERFQSYCDHRGFKKSTLIVRLIHEHLDSEIFAVQVELPLGGGRLQQVMEEGGG